MRKVNIGTNNFTVVHVMDEPADGGACHEYCINEVGNSEILPVEYGCIKFQKGPIKENGVNGCHQEDLIAIVIDRLQCFQAGDYACMENREALKKMEEALVWLNSRTADRQTRGVEGTSVL